MISRKALAVAATVALATIGGTAHAQFVVNSPDFTTPEAVASATRVPAGSPLTRDQVVAQREQARRDGTLVVDYVTGKPLFGAAANEPAMAGKSRADIRAEVEQARRDGTLVVSDITGKPYYGVNKRTVGTGAE